MVSEARAGLEAWGVRVVWQGHLEQGGLAVKEVLVPAARAAWVDQAEKAVKGELGILPA